MTPLIVILGLVFVALAVFWPANSRRWGGDEVPPGARRYSAPPDPEWEPWAYLDFPTPADVPPLPEPQPATFHVGEPEALPVQRRMIGDGR